MLPRSPAAAASSNEAGATKLASARPIKTGLQPEQRFSNVVPKADIASWSGLGLAPALEFDSDFARAGSPVTMAALGSNLPLAAFHPDAHGVREAIRRVAVEPSLVWVDCQARKDMLNFQDCDIVRGLGTDARPQRCNPLYTGK